MNENTDLNSFLEALRGDGESIDTGSVTINPAKARAKLSKYQLSDPELWVVKLVQAATACSSSRIDFTFGRSSVIVKFTAADDWDAESIYQLIMLESIPEDRALAHLVTGLRALLSIEYKMIRFGVGVSSLTLDEQGTRTEPHREGREFILETSRPSRSTALKRLLSATLSFLVSQTLDEWTALARRCWVGPTKLYIDGRPMRIGYSAVPHEKFPHEIVRRETRLHKCMGFVSLTNVDGRPRLPSFIRGIYEVEVTNSSSVYDTFVRWTPRNGPAFGALSLHTSRHVFPTVDFVLDGAVVESRLIEPIANSMRRNLRASPLVLPRFMFPVRPEELDLSGFSVRNIDHLGLVSQSLEECESLIDLVLKELKDYQGSVSDEKKYLAKELEKLRRMLERI